MPDFTLNTFQRLLTTLKDQKYTFQTFAAYLKDPAPRTIILRHDVDARKMNSLKTAQIENEMGITGTYYFRMVPESFDEEVIKQIAEMGHEIGYHYEDVSLTALRRKGVTAQRLNGSLDEELLKVAIASFSENLAKLRRVVPVETICMHGSPLSKYDNRMLWEKYDYKDFGIIGEPYFDINFDEVLYLTDTGRTWDGDSVNIRDKAEVQGGTKRLRDLGTKSEEHPEPHTARRTPILRFDSTFDIIDAAKNDLLPNKIMLTVHPQRWDNRPFPWLKELVWQNIKNLGKRLITSTMHYSA